MRTYTSGLKEKLHRQEDLQETINSLNQEIEDLRHRFSHGRDATDASTATSATGSTFRAPKTSRTLADDMAEPPQEQPESEGESDGGTETVVHTTTVRRVKVR